MAEDEQRLPEGSGSPPGTGPAKAHARRRGSERGHSEWISVARVTTGVWLGMEVLKAGRIAPPDHATGSDTVGSQRPPGTPRSARWG